MTDRQQIVMALVLLVLAAANTFLFYWTERLEHRIQRLEHDTDGEA